MARRLSSEAYQLAETYHLGKPTAIYDTGFKSQLNIALSVSGCVLVFSLSLALCRNSFRFDHRSWLLYGIMFGCVLFACLFIFIIIIIPRISTRDFCVYVCTDGLIYKKQQDVEIIRWDEIERVDYANILCKDGTKIKINRYIDNLDSLKKNIKRKMKRYRQNQSKKGITRDMSDFLTIICQRS